MYLATALIAVHVCCATTLEYRGIVWASAGGLRHTTTKPSNTDSVFALRNGLPEETNAVTFWHNDNDTIALCLDDQYLVAHFFFLFRSVNIVLNKTRHC
jgi:hypothetical protein